GLVSTSYDANRTLTGEFDNFELCSLEILPNPSSENCVSEAENDAFGTGGGHALWMPGIATKLVMTTPGSWTEFDNGTARFVGTVETRNDPTKGFDVVLNLSGYTTVPPAGSPKRELRGNVYAPNGPIDTSTWYYYPDFSATLTGNGQWAGAVVEVTRRGPSFQVGEGANGKNVHYGAAAWFDYQVIQQPTTGVTLQTNGRGDFNLDLVCPSINPLPVCPALDDGTTNSADHAVAMPGIAKDLLSNAGGTFEAFDDGTAMMVFTVHHENDPSKVFDVFVDLAGYTTTPPPGSPKLEMPGSAYVPVGIADPALWVYYQSFEATFYGRDAWAGAVVRVTQRGPSWQEGIGANNKNLDYGASAWFDYQVLQQPNGGSLQTSGVGDFNVSLGSDACP
ncbi:MAG: hypothetical protein AAGD06_23650, partial [Acidobacteriota bacterium]